MARVYLGNAFSPSMLSLKYGETVDVCVKRLSLVDLETYYVVAREAGKLDCAIGHQGTARLVERLLGGKGLACERKMIQLQPGDTLLVVALGFRPPEGKLYTIEELDKLYVDGKIHFYAVHYGPC